MRIRVFLLAAVLLALVGLCAVQESARQTRAEYALAKLLAAERQAARELDGLRAREASLTSVERLNALSVRLALGLQPLHPRPDRPAGQPTTAFASPDR